MKSLTGLSIFMIIILFSCSYSTMSQDIPEIRAEELPEYRLSRNECFDGKSLWGYMNGGADIFLEYGFDGLRVEEFTRDDETIKLELFKMKDPNSAFGIYSFKTFKCQHSNVISPIDCLTQYQFQLICGNYYIHLMNESGSEQGKETMILMAEILLKKIVPTELKLPIIYLTDSLNFSLSDIKMLEGVLGIQNKAMMLTGYFEGIKAYQIYFAKTVLDGEKVSYFEIVFSSPEMKAQFIKNTKGKDLEILKVNDLNLLARY